MRLERRRLVSCLAHTAFHVLGPARPATLAPTQDGDVPEPVCGRYGASAHGLRYVITDMHWPKQMVFDDEGQARPKVQVVQLACTAESTGMTVLPQPVRILGLAGLLPQAACLGAMFMAPEWRFTALAAGTFYPALILSFLGGLWWMQALAAGEQRWLPYVLSVLPSLAAWALLLPWCFGWQWPGPQLPMLALLLAASPLIDRKLARMVATTLPLGWLQLRWQMAGGLAVLTMLLAVV